MAKELLSNGFHLSAAFSADQLLFRDFQKHFLFRKMIQHFSLAAFFSLMCRNENGIGVGFFNLMVLAVFCFVKQAELVFSQNIILLFTGLTKAGTFGVGSLPGGGQHPH